MIFFFILVPAAQHEAIIALSLGFLGVAVSDAGDFLIEYAVVDVGLFGMEIFVEGCPDDAVGVDDNSKLFGDF